MEGSCDKCGYDWDHYLERHRSRGDCEVNLRLRGHLATGVLQTTFPTLSVEEAKLVESAGLEVWAHPDNPEKPTAPYWVWAVCQQVALKDHRGWLLESLIRDPKMYLKISRDPGGIGKVLLSLMVQRRK